MNKKIDGVNYSIRKIKVGEMLPLLPRFEKETLEVQREMVSICVSVNGEIIGDGVDELDWQAYSVLSQAVLIANGFPIEEEVGNE